MGALRLTLGATWDHQDPFWAQPVITKKHFGASIIPRPQTTRLTKYPEQKTIKNDSESHEA